METTKRNCWNKDSNCATISKIQNKNKLAKPTIDLKFSIPYITRTQIQEPKLLLKRKNPYQKKGPHPSINCTPNTSNKKTYNF